MMMMFKKKISATVGAALIAIAIVAPAAQANDPWNGGGSTCTPQTYPYVIVCPPYAYLAKQWIALSAPVPSGWAVYDATSTSKQIINLNGAPWYASVKLKNNPYFPHSTNPIPNGWVKYGLESDGYYTIFKAYAF
ncbi:hypothetical protein K0T92_08365 [Paenibacillus oenotherae]|uniref:Uncharacterized protein n=1 Tax=Paenibacillus oenotherae TaxID=1435645 RepID=A0ABS7D495_9BACL|nr:hypothetical protein [Paenibacillus oenotherae]MBW7474757.1 hypothetical protein [Paenibacillus oenotherae]